MLAHGKEILDLELENDGFSFDETTIFKLKPGTSAKMVFLGGIDGIVSWVQHQWWVEDRYSKNPGEMEVTKNVIFPSLKENWSDDATVCPGSIMGSEGEKKYAAIVLVDEGNGIPVEKAFFFGKAIWGALVETYRSLKADFGPEADIGDKWLRLNNDGKGATRYSVHNNGIPFKDHATYKPTLEIEKFIKTYSFSEVVNKMVEAGIPITERLAELKLDHNGKPLPE